MIHEYMHTQRIARSKAIHATQHWAIKVSKLVHLTIIVNSMDVFLTNYVWPRHCEYELWVVAKHLLLSGRMRESFSE